jgi:cell fate (sporulation/competence/biofilm development) regulator YmcA (YheA/YmcA/DUF963 family)
VIISSTEESIFVATISGDRKNEQGETVKVYHKAEIKPNRPIKVHKDLAEMLKSQYKERCTIQNEAGNGVVSINELKQRIVELEAKLAKPAPEVDPYPDKTDQELRALIQERTGTMPHFNVKRANLISQLSE